MQPNCRPYLPPEWAPQSGVMLTWPHPHGDWAPRLANVEPAFAAITREIARRERALVVCYDDSHRAHVANTLKTAGVDSAGTILTIAPSNDTWARDHGPISVLCREQPLLLDFGFNGWGRKYAHDLDNLVTRRLYAQGVFGNAPIESFPMILEGGSIEVDGSGTLLTTSQCLLAATRNPGLSRTEIEQELCEWLGLNRVLWLDHGRLEGDDTDSHIDTLARFCDAKTIVYVACDDRGDPHYDDLKAMEAQLQTFRAADDSPYRLVPLPWPRPKYDDGRRLPATYANFLIINAAVLAPIYDDPADALALAQLQKCFPDREIIGVDCSAIIAQFGSLHCLTMQLPRGIL